MLCIPFTYLIGWSNLNKWYYGVRYAKNANPNQLFLTYFTSSRYVLEYIKDNGDPDIILIRKTFTSVKKARQWEECVLRRIDVMHSDKWLNKHNGNAPPIMFGPCSTSRQKSISISRLNTPKIHCVYCDRNIDPGNYTQFHGEKCKLNPHVDPNILIQRSIRAKNAILKQMQTGTFSKPKVPVGMFTCPNCNKQSANWGALHRYHFENCSVTR